MVIEPNVVKALISPLFLEIWWMI